MALEFKGVLEKYQWGERWAVRADLSDMSVFLFFSTEPSLEVITEAVEKHINTMIEQQRQEAEMQVNEDPQTDPQGNPQADQ